MNDFRMKVVKPNLQSVSRKLVRYARSVGEMRFSQANFWGNVISCCPIAEFEAVCRYSGSLLT